MKTLLFTLILMFQGDIWDGLGGPYVKSELVQLAASQDEIESRSPNLIALQSVRAASGEYFLLLEVKSRDGYFDAACPLNLTVDNKDLTLPCSRGPERSIEVIEGAKSRSEFKTHSTSYYAVRSRKIKSVLSAKSIQVKVGANTFKLSDRQLNSLRSVLR